MSTPNPTPRRRLTLADLVLLVVASAFALALGRFWHEVGRNTPAHALYGRWNRALTWVNAGLIAATVSLLIARFLPPRPSLREALRQVGTLTLTLLVGDWIVLAIQRRLWHTLSADLIGISYSYLGSIMTMFAPSGRDVCLIWVALASVGGWKSEPDWVDRSGRFVCIFAILYWITKLILS